jgi:hypothetical protein
MTMGANIAAVAALVGELARVASIAASTASEHLAGALGWVKRREGRALSLTAKGRDGYRELLGLDLQDRVVAGGSAFGRPEPFSAKSKK